MEHAVDDSASSAAAICTKFLESPLSRQTNLYLEQGGVLVRAVDAYDEPNRTHVQTGEPTHYKYVPASYMHASLRPSRAIYDEPKFARFSILIGSHYARNRNNGTDESMATVDCHHYYPTDANSLGRGTMEDPPQCYKKAVQYICPGGVCLHDGCDKCHNMTTVTSTIIQYVERRKRKKGTQHSWRLGHLFYHSCWSDEVHEMITIANDLWLRRHEWWEPLEEIVAKFQRLPPDYQYEGWTECQADKTIQDTSLIDAIVISMTNCELVANMTVVSEALHVAHTNPGFENLPILFHREAKGSTEDHCKKFWGGEHCDDGWRKQFSSLPELDFTDGSCLRRAGCEELYFYPKCFLAEIKPRCQIQPSSERTILCPSCQSNFRAVLTDQSKFISMASLMTCFLVAFVARFGRSIVRRYLLGKEHV